MGTVLRQCREGQTWSIVSYMCTEITLFFLDNCCAYLDSILRSRLGKRVTRGAEAEVAHGRLGVADAEILVDASL